MHTGQETSPIVTHAVGRWYEKKAPGEQRVFSFMLLEPAVRTFHDTRHGAKVVLETGEIVQLVWRPENVRLRPWWGRRLLEWVTGHPLLQDAAEEHVHIKVKP
jgi:hypothetical protein